MSLFLDGGLGFRENHLAIINNNNVIIFLYGSRVKVKANLDSVTIKYDGLFKASL